MQNFGRGMWRRVGDYERVRAPMIEQQTRIEQWKQFMLYQEYLNRKNKINVSNNNKEEQKVTNVEEELQVTNVEEVINVDEDIVKSEKSVKETKAKRQKGKK